MKNFLIIFNIAFLSLLLTACSSDNGDENNNIQMSGAVADGYLTNAKVCLDLNNSNACDNGEPFGISVAKGKYSFTAKKTDAAKFSVVVEITDEGYVVDSDSPGAYVDKTYTLSAPAGEYKFISPITTMVNIVLKNNAIKLAEAKSIIATKLRGESISPLPPLDPLADYIEKTSAGNIYEDVHKVARTIASIMAKSAIKLNDILANPTPKQKRLVFVLATKKIEKKLAQISSVVKAADSVSAIETIENGISTDIGTESSGDLIALLADIDEQQRALNDTSILSPQAYVNLAETTHLLKYDVMGNGKVQNHEFNTNGFYQNEKDFADSADNNLYTLLNKTGTYAIDTDGIMTLTLLKEGGDKQIKITQFKETDLSGKTLSLPSFFTSSEGLPAAYKKATVALDAGSKSYEFTFHKQAKADKPNLVDSTPDEIDEIDYGDLCGTIAEPLDCQDYTDVYGYQTPSTFFSAISATSGNNATSPSTAIVINNNKHLLWFGETSTSYDTAHYCTKDNTVTSPTTCITGTEFSIPSYYYYNSNNAYVADTVMDSAHQVLRIINMEDYINEGKLSLSVYFFKANANSEPPIKKQFKEWLMEEFLEDVMFFNQNAIQKAVDNINGLGGDL